MDIQKLIHMANQIGQFFDAMPDRAEAESGVANHLHNFWDPRMRAQLLEHLDQNDGKGLSPLVGAAVRNYREKIASGTSHAANG